MKVKSYLNKKLTNAIGISNKQNRSKWIETTLKNIKPGSKILDAGAGECQYKIFCNHLEYTSQDIAQYDGLGNGLGVQKGSRDYKEIDIVSDITNIPLNPNSFDVILCSEVLEHVVDPLSALGELTRILKIDGLLILTAPFMSMTHYAPYHYSTGFNKYFYTHHLEKLGYEIMEITPNGNYFEYLAQEVRNMQNVTNQYANKNLSILDKISKLLYLKSLNKFNNLQKGSDELLNFGYHVVAKKLN